SHLAPVSFLQSRAHLSISPLHFLQVRTFRPSSRRRYPTRVGLSHSGQTTIRFDRCTEASFSTIPPLTFFCGFGFVCLLMMLIPSTIAPCFFETILRILPFLPRSFPVSTR